MSAAAPARRNVLAAWVTDLALGARLSVAGGRSGWVRLALISAGIGLGVAMLLFTATIPTLFAARDARLATRAETTERSLARGPDTLLIAAADTAFRDVAIHGRLVQPEGDRAPLPPGVQRRLAPGEMVASPALARLLASDEGALLRSRWPARMVGTIEPAGLSGPAEYAFYLGTDRLTEDTARRLRSFGQREPSTGLPPELLLLGLVGLVVLLLPVAVFVTTAVRFGGEARDRRLAAVRLVGADTAMCRRIAAGDTLVGAVLGLLVGALLYLTVAMQTGPLMPRSMSFYPGDFRPVPALTVLVAVLVPVGSVLVTLAAMRRVVVEPLGVVRRSGERRRRLWWRLVLPLGGVALLYPLRNGLPERVSEDLQFQITLAVMALLVGVALLLPWLVEATVRRLGGPGVAWQLAVRRLQLDSGTAVRAVSGIAVSVAGAIALQGLLAAVQTQFTQETGLSTDHFQAVVHPGLDSDDAWLSSLRNTPGVRAVESAITMSATEAGSAPGSGDTRMVIGSCAVLRQTALVDTCADGDTFVAAYQAPTPRPGSYELSSRADSAAGEPLVWTLPATARAVALNPGSPRSAGSATILATPAAVRGALPASLLADSYYVGLDRSSPDALDRVRNTVAGKSLTAYVFEIETRTVAAALLAIRQGLLVGAAALLVLIGASMLINVAEQLRERRRVLAVLVAVGIRRSTLSGSVLYQVAIPVLLGLALAVVTGTALAAMLQALADAPIRFDWSGIGTTTGAAALVVLLTTTASLPLLWRLTKPGGLRSE